MTAWLSVWQTLARLQLTCDCKCKAHRLKWWQEMHTQEFAPHCFSIGDVSSGHHGIPTAFCTCTRLFCHSKQRFLSPGETDCLLGWSPLGLWHTKVSTASRILKTTLWPKPSLQQHLWYGTKSSHRALHYCRCKRLRHCWPDCPKSTGDKKAQRTDIHKWLFFYNQGSKLRSTLDSVAVKRNGAAFHQEQTRHHLCLQWCCHHMVHNKHLSVYHDTLHIRRSSRARPISKSFLPEVPHKALAEVSKIGNL